MTQPDSRQLIAMLLDAIEQENRDRPEFVRAIGRADAGMLLERVARLYGTGEGSAASIYAVVALQDAVKAIFRADPHS